MQWIRPVRNRIRKPQNNPNVSNVVPRPADGKTLGDINNRAFDGDTDGLQQEEP